MLQQNGKWNIRAVLDDRRFVDYTVTGENRYSAVEGQTAIFDFLKCQSMMGVLIRLALLNTISSR